MKNKGFTYIEILIYIVLSAFVISSLIGFGLNIVYSRVKSQVEEEVNQNIRLAERRIDYEIRNASGINSVTASSISLSNSDATRNPTVIDVNSGKIRIGYGASGSCPAATPCTLTDNKVAITSLVFVNLTSGGATTKNIQYSVTAKSSGNTQDYIYLKTYESTSEIRSN